MKTIAAMMLVICVLMMQTVYAQEIPPDAPSPSEAVRGMLETISTWEQGEIPDFLAEEPDAQAYLNTFGGVIEQLAGRVSYEVHAHKITGYTAVVDVGISAVDIGGAVGVLLTQSATYLAFQRVMGRPADLNGYLSSRTVAVIPELNTIAAEASAYMILGADGEWKLDLSDQRNLGLLNAMCGGGILPYITAIETLTGRVSG